MKQQGQIDLYSMQMRKKSMYPALPSVQSVVLRSTSIHSPRYLNSHSLSLLLLFLSRSGQALFTPWRPRALGARSRCRDALGRWRRVRHRIVHETDAGTAGEGAGYALLEGYLKEQLTRGRGEGWWQFRAKCGWANVGDVEGCGGVESEKTKRQKKKILTYPGCGSCTYDIKPLHLRT